MRALTDKETATVLAALRLFQEMRADASKMPHFEDVEPLSNDEIDTLCEWLNTYNPDGSPPATKGGAYEATREAAIKAAKEWEQEIDVLGVSQRAKVTPSQDEDGVTNGYWVEAVIYIPADELKEEK